MIPGSGAAGGDWRPTAELSALRRRAELAARVRRFFAARGVLEVETPLLGAATTPEPHLDSLSCRTGGRTWYLQTSPELHMKRLLAAGSGPIYQLARAVRGGESGRHHNLEFTLLEWYRPGWDHHRLMDEIDELLAALGVADRPARRVTWAEAFRSTAGVDPHAAGAAELDGAVAAAGVPAPPFAPDDRDGRLDLLMGLVVAPRLGPGPVFVLDFPASQASLARVRPGEGGAPAIAERFELFAGGLELANGFHELTDAAEQRRRFAADLEARRRRGLAAVPVDERMLAALEAGLPDCAGVAIGFDRLAMLASGAGELSAVLAFPSGRA